MDELQREIDEYEIFLRNETKTHILPILREAQNDVIHEMTADRQRRKVSAEVEMANAVKYLLLAELEHDAESITLCLLRCKTISSEFCGPDILVWYANGHDEDYCKSRVDHLLSVVHLEPEKAADVLLATFMTVYTPVVEDGKRIMHFDVFSPGKNLCKCLDSLVLAIKMKAELDNYDHDTVDEWIASRGGMNKFASNYSLLDGAHFETALDALYLAFKSDVDEIVEVYVAEGGESSDGESSVDETDGSSVEEGDEVSMDSGRVNLIEDDSDGDVR